MNAYFLFRSALCGYNLSLQYPQPEHFPTLNAPIPDSPSASSGTKLTKKQFMLEMQDRLVAELRKRESEDALLEHSERLRARDMWKRDLAGRANGTIDPWYLCDVYTEMIDYAINFTFPWCTYPFLPILYGCLHHDSPLQHLVASSISTISPMR
jgi:carboxypeptidase D